MSVLIAWFPEHLISSKMWICVYTTLTIMARLLNIFNAARRARKVTGSLETPGGYPPKEAKDHISKIGIISVFGNAEEAWTQLP